MAGVVGFPYFFPRGPLQLPGSTWVCWRRLLATSGLMYALSRYEQIKLTGIAADSRVA